MMEKIKVDQLKCTGCGNCVLYCPPEAIIPTMRFIPEVEDDACTECLICIGVCPNEALKEAADG